MISNLAEKQVVLSSKLTGFSIEDKDTLKLMTPEGNIAFDYGAFVVPVAIVPALVQKSVVRNEVSENVLTPLVETSSEIPAESLGITALSIDAIPEEVSTSYIPAIIATLLIGACASGVYFIRQRKAIGVGNDFEILDE